MLHLYAPILIAMLYKDPLAGVWWMLVVHTAGLVARWVLWRSNFHVSQYMGAFGLVLRSIGLALPALGGEWIWFGGAISGVGSALFFTCSGRLVYAHAASKPGKHFAGNEMARSLGSLLAAFLVVIELVAPGKSALITGGVASMLSAVFLVAVPMKDKTHQSEKGLPPVKVPLKVLFANLSMANEVIILAPLIVAAGATSGWLAVGVAAASFMLSPFIGYIYDKRAFHLIWLLMGLNIMAWCALFVFNYYTELVLSVAIVAALTIAKLSQNALDQWRHSASASLCTNRAGEVVATLQVFHSLGATCIVAFACLVAHLNGGGLPAWVLLLAPLANIMMVLCLHRFEKVRAIEVN